MKVIIKNGKLYYAGRNSWSFLKKDAKPLHMKRAVNLVQSLVMHRMQPKSSTERGYPFVGFDLTFIPVLE